MGSKTKECAAYVTTFSFILTFAVNEMTFLTRNGLVWQRHVQNRTEQSSGLLVLELVKSDDVI
jgi:hypothetical protein